MVPSATLRCTWSRTRWLPYDLDTSRATIAGADDGLVMRLPLLSGCSACSLGRRIRREVTGGPERSAPVLPLDLEHGQALDQEIGEGGPLQQDRPPLGFDVSE